MPIQFEGLSYGTEKSAVIFDVGYSYTKAGFAGDTAPKCIIPSESVRTRAGEPWRSPLKVWDTFYNKKKALYDALVDFFHRIYFRNLLVNPKDRRVVVVESVLCPSEFRTVLAQVFFNHFEVPSLLFIPSHLAALLPLGTQTGLVLDAGYKESLVIPVLNGMPLLNAWCSAPLAFLAVQNHLKSLLIAEAELTECDGSRRTLTQAISRSSDLFLTDDILEDLVVRTCFVTTVERAEKLVRGDSIESPYGIEYPLRDGRILHLPGSLRERAPETLFQLDNDQENIATLFLNALLRCPVDARRQLAGSLLLTGGCVHIPGFAARLQVEFMRLIASCKKYSVLQGLQFLFHTSLASPNYISWQGAAVLGALEVLPIRSISRETFLENGGRVPDWTDWRPLGNGCVDDLISAGDQRGLK